MIYLFSCVKSMFQPIGTCHIWECSWMFPNEFIIVIDFSFTLWAPCRMNLDLWLILASLCGDHVEWRKSDYSSLLSHIRLVKSYEWIYSIVHKLNPPPSLLPIPPPPKKKHQYIILRIPTLSFCFFLSSKTICGQNTKLIICWTLIKEKRKKIYLQTNLKETSFNSLYGS